jgi:ABC-type Zn uptake system ZnuABC Zn-binding protein ZnuA
MNHTHYALVNEDNEVVAVILRNGFKERVIKAIEDETGSEVYRVEFEESDYNNYKVTAKTSQEGESYSAWLRPTWEY